MGGKGSGSGDGMILEDATSGMLKKDQVPYLCQKFCSSESRILVFLVVYGLEIHMLSLIQSISLVPKYFCKTEANSVSQRRSR